MTVKPEHKTKHTHESYYALRQPLHWQPIETLHKTAACALPLYHCLSETGSMTTYLKRLGAVLRVSLLYQGIRTIDNTDLANYMGVSDQNTVFMRRVILISDDVPVLFGQCVMRIDVYEKNKAWLMHLGEQAIGERLFQNAMLQRSPISYTQLQPNSAYHTILANTAAAQMGSLWARRSQLYDDSIRVGIVEVCLPALVARLTQ